MKQFSSISSTEIGYNDKIVKAKIVSITSCFNHNTEFFFAQEMIKENTLEIVKPYATIQLLKDNLDFNLWQEGFIYELNVKPYGLINIWGVHYINIIKIDQANTQIITEERNNICKVWNHSLTFKKVNESQTEYTDEVILYAGKLTKFLSYFLVLSYKQRHRNWNNKLNKLLNMR